VHPILALVALLPWSSRSEEWRTIPLAKGFSVDSPAPLPQVKHLVENGEDATYWGALHGQAVLTAFASTLDLKAFPGILPDEILANSAQGFLDSGNCKIKGEKDLLFNGWPGVEIDCVSDNGIHARYRCYSVGASLYGATVTWSGNNAEPADTSRFLESMCLPARAGHGTQKTAGPAFAPISIAGARITINLPKKPEIHDDVLGSKEMPLKLTRMAASYLNRHYACLYVDMPPEEVESLPEHEQEAMEAINAQIIAGAKGASPHSSSYRLGKQNVYSCRAKVQGSLAIRVDTFAKGSRIFAVMAVAPEVMMDSAEIKAFFTSIKPD
jgi:hypothetical protein